MNRFAVRFWLGICCLNLVLLSCQETEPPAEPISPFPWNLPQEKPDRPMSKAMERLYDEYRVPQPEENELYSNFAYTKLSGFDYNGGDGTISRRDPSKVLFENGKYYVWYTKRESTIPPQGPEKCNDTIPSSDWDLADLWYATSVDGFHWEEEGIAVARPAPPAPGWRAVTTPDVLKFKGKFYLYFQSFLEASGKKGDHCPVSVAYADAPDGPWTLTHEIVIPNGPPGSWDQYAIHDPYPLVYNGKIYLYYKSVFGERPDFMLAQGLAIADDPLGPFEKHPLNPVLNSGHETALFPFEEGIAALVIRNGHESNTIQYSPDGVHFSIASVSTLLPIAAGPFVPDAFTSNGNGRGITWGLSHFFNAAGTWKKNHSQMARFDCELSLDVDDPFFKSTQLILPPDVYYTKGMSPALREKRAGVPE
ncbi:MAG: family 43 glycosylhydrolase [Bacteroidota bacterium]